MTLEVPKYVKYRQFLHSIAVYPANTPLAFDNSNVLDCREKPEDETLAVSKINNFGAELKKWIEDVPEKGRKTIHKAQIFELKFSIYQAIYGKNGGGGLNGIKDIIKGKDAKMTLNSTIKTLIKYSQKMHLTSDELPECPAEKYTDSQWALEMEICQNLKPEPVGKGRWLWHQTVSYGQQLVKKFRETIHSTLINDALDIVKKGCWWKKLVFLNEKKTDIYLGALPLTTSDLSRDDLTTLRINVKIKAVLAITEVFETTYKSGMYSPVRPTKWKEKGVNFLQIHAPDYTSIFHEQIQKAIAFIHWNITKGHNILIHSKTGLKRSALVTMCYLMKHRKMQPNEAFYAIKREKYIQDKTTEWDVEFAKDWARAREFHDLLSKQKEKS